MQTSDRNTLLAIAFGSFEDILLIIQVSKKICDFFLETSTPNKEQHAIKLKKRCVFTEAHGLLVCIRKNEFESRLFSLQISGCRHL